MTPFQRLLNTVDTLQDDLSVARLLAVYPSYIQQWRPRERMLDDGRVVIESGLEPSGGFIATANVILSHAHP